MRSPGKMCGSFAPRFTRKVSHGGDSDNALRRVVLSKLAQPYRNGGAKIDKLTEHVKKHSYLVELAYRPEQDMTVTRRNVNPLYERMDR